MSATLKRPPFYSHAPPYRVKDLTTTTDPETREALDPETREALFFIALSLFPPSPSHQNEIKIKQAERGKQRNNPTQNCIGKKVFFFGLYWIGN